MKAVARLAFVLLLALAGAWQCAARRPTSLLLVTIDTLRADRLGSYGHQGAETPILDGLARRGARFQNAQAAVPLTGPSHATLLTGLPPPVHGVRDNVTFSLDERHARLSTLLKSRGYRTAAFVGAYPLAADIGFGRGFDVYDEGFHQVPVPGQGAERPANEVTDAAVRWLSANAGEPFFAWVHFYDPHAPYAPPPPFADRFRDRPYDGEVAFTDSQLGRVLEALARAGRERDTLVAVVADHGEALGEHGEETHAVLVYQSTLHVPFLLAGPGVPEGRVVAERVGGVDLAPTLLGLLGVTPPSPLPGRDLRPALRGERLPHEALYAESLFGRLNCRWSALRALVDGDFKLIQGVRPELYDLAADPGEAKDLAAREPERVRRLQAMLQAALGAMAPSGDAARAVALSAQQEERLRSLGYAGGGTGGQGALDDPGLPDPRERVALYESLQRLLGADGARLAPAALEASRFAAADPKNPFAHFAAASLLRRAGRFAEAGRAYARSLELDPDRPAIRQMYGRLLRELDLIAESERELRIAVEQATASDSVTRVSLAETLILAGKLDEAERLLEQVLGRDPNQLDAIGARGKLLLARGRPREALPLLERATAIPEPERWLDVGQAQLVAGDAGQAARAARQALKLSPSHAWALALAGHALVLQGERRGGLAVLEEALAIGPRRPAAWGALADGFAAAGRDEQAALCRRRAREARSPTG
jgi:arylsulfatase A-like enzyme/Tfp pilus assembly protein PilF